LGSQQPVEQNLSDTSSDDDDDDDDNTLQIVDLNPPKRARGEQQNDFDAQQHSANQQNDKNEATDDNSTEAKAPKVEEPNDESLADNNHPYCFIHSQHTSTHSIFTYKMIVS
jgi:hypothetical protein